MFGSISCRRVAAWLLQAGMFATLAVAAVPMQTVVLTGDQAPGTEPGVVFARPGVSFGSAFLTPSINSAGLVGFRGILEGPGVDDNNDYGLWAGAAGAVQKVARPGDPAAGLPDGAVYRNIQYASTINDLGQITFRGDIDGPGVTPETSSGIWSGAANAVAKVARSGDAAPGFGEGVVYSSFHNMTPLHGRINDAGQVAFRATVAGPGVSDANHSALWRGVPGASEVVIRAGDPAPGTALGFGDFDELNLNDSGQVVFTAWLSDAAGPVDAWGVWMGDSGSIQKVGLAGERPPGTPTTVRYAALDGVRINSAGAVAFQGVLEGAGVNDQNNTGIWAGTPGVVKKIVRAGEPAVGTTPAVDFTGVLDPSALNDAGQVVFAAYTSANSPDFNYGYGLWIGGPQGLSKIMHAGDAVPGAAPGVAFSNAASSVVLNNLGQVAFQASLYGPGVDATNSNGIWATTLDDRLVSIVRAGDSFDVNADPLIDDFRRVSGARLNGEDVYSGSRVFNDAGQLVLMLRFTDGSSGLFVATVPEPASWLTGLLMAALGLPRRWTR